MNLTNLISNIVALGVIIAMLVYAAYMAHTGKPIGTQELVVSVVSLLGIFGLSRMGTKDKIKMVVFMCSGLLAMSIGGCVGGSHSLNSDGVNVSEQPLSSTRMKGDDMQASFQGAAPSVTNLDAKGTYNVMQGPHAVLGFDANTGNVYVLDPKNTQIGHIKYTPKPAPGMAMLEIDNLNANLSDVVSVYAAQFKDAMDAMKGMTQEKAKVWIQTAVTAGEVIPSLAKMLLESFVPTLPSSP